jgi:hypothetical protein
LKTTQGNRRALTFQLLPDADVDPAERYR